MEPIQAQHWAGVAEAFINSGSVPGIDKRKHYTDQTWTGEMLDTGPVFRVNENGAVDPKGSIQVFRMDAPIAKYDYCGDPGSQTWMQHFQAAYADKTVSSVLIIADSPGGQVDGTESLAKVIAAKNKPVVTYVNSMMCSAMYWIGSSADMIVADGANNGWNATIGSIGTMAMFLDDSEKMSKDGLKRVLVFADASTDKWGDYFNVMKGDFSRLKQELNGLNATFLDAVKTNREGKLDLEKENVLTGKTYNATEALKYGLIDKIGGFEEAIKTCLSLAKKQKTLTMSKQNISFQNVMNAASANEIAVVEGGFMLTEEQLNKIDAKLDQDATVLASTAKELKTLQANATAESSALEQVAQLTAQVQDLTTKAQALETDNANLKQQNEELSKAGKQFFGAAQGSATAEEPKPAHQATEADLDNLAHNVMADKFFGKI